MQTDGHPSIETENAPVIQIPVLKFDAVTAGGGNPSATMSEAEPNGSPAWGCTKPGAGMPYASSCKAHFHNCGYAARNAAPNGGVSMNPTL
jgi:hypothetical protein